MTYCLSMIDRPFVRLPIVMALALCGFVACNDVDLGNDKDSGVADSDSKIDGHIDPIGDCIPGQHYTCNGSTAVKRLMGQCNDDGTCTCNEGFEVDKGSGLCKPMSPACTPGMDQTCNNNPAISAVLGHCNEDGTCSCAPHIVDELTGRCVSVNEPPMDVCTPGKDQTCNDEMAFSSFLGHCEDDRTCTCRTDAVINPATGRCRPAACPAESCNGLDDDCDGQVDNGDLCSGNLVCLEGKCVVSDCTAEITALGNEMYAAPAQACTAVVRLDHNTLAILGYELFCDKHTAVSEADARVTAEQDSGYGGGGQSVPNTSYHFVFYEAPGDFGGVAAVSGSTGLTVFGGSIHWMGSGEITYPKVWRDPNTIGQNCPSTGMPSNPAYGYDLVKGGAPLPQAEVDAAIAVVEKTAIPGGLWKGGYLLGYEVLRYPRTVGAFDPSNAEWIVLVTGGWLE